MYKYNILTLINFLRNVRLHYVILFLLLAFVFCYLSLPFGSHQILYNNINYPSFKYTVTYSYQISYNNTLWGFYSVPTISYYTNI